MPSWLERRRPRSLPTPALAQTPKRGGTLRFIPIGDLKVLDPIWTTAYITRDHGYMIWDTLFAQDADFQIKPQMVDKYTQSKDGMKWSFTLREGLRLRDGQPVTSEDCVASIIRWGKKDPLGKLLFAATSKLQASDKKTFLLELREPFGAVLDALGKPSSNVPFIMPARLAATSPDEQVKEAISYGPFKIGLRRQTGRRARCDGPSRAARSGARDAGAADEDRCRRRSASGGLSTLLSRRARKEPPSAGGWNIFCTNWISADVLTPAVNAGIAGGGEKGWFGWSSSPELEKLRTDWMRTADPAKRKQLAEQIQVVAFDEVPYVTWGQYVQPSLYRKNVRGVLQFRRRSSNVSMEG